MTEFDPLTAPACEVIAHLEHMKAASQVCGMPYGTPHYLMLACEFKRGTNPTIAAREFVERRVREVHGDAGCFNNLSFIEHNDDRTRYLFSVFVGKMFGGDGNRQIVGSTALLYVNEVE